MNPELWRLRVRILLAIASGALLLLAFPPVDAGYAAWVALVPLFLALRGASARAGALCGFVAGLAYFGGLLYWIASFGIVAWIPLTVLQALAWALFGWFGAWASHRWLGRLAGLPLLFAAFEIVRERFPFGGFGWGLLGTSQHGGGPLLPLARAGGVFALGVAVAFLNAAAAEAIGEGRIWKRALSVVLATAAVFGASSLPLGFAGPVHGRIEIAAVQVNVRAFGLQRGQRSGPEDVEILERLAAVTQQIEGNPPDLVVWPENALDRDPFANREVGDRVAEVVRNVGAPFLVGAILDAGERTFRNALLLYDASGRVTGHYDKQHLVPFGEYVPFPSLRKRIGALDQVPYDGVPGTASVVFDVGGGKVGGLICFESTFPELARDFVHRGAQILVVATNNASFGRSTAAAEHLAQSQIRAVEEGRVVVHSAISGISAVVEPDGRVHDRTQLFTPDLIRASVGLTTGETPYAQFGDAIELGLSGTAAAVALAGFAGMLARRRDRREKRAMGEFDWGPERPDAPPEPVEKPEIPAEPSVSADEAPE